MYVNKIREIDYLLLGNCYIRFSRNSREFPRKFWEFPFSRNENIVGNSQSYITRSSCRSGASRRWFQIEVAEIYLILALSNNVFTDLERVNSERGGHRYTTYACGLILGKKPYWRLVYHFGMYTS